MNASPSGLEEVHGGEAGVFANALPEVHSESEVAGPEGVPSLPTLRLQSAVLGTRKMSFKPAREKSQLVTLNAWWRLTMDIMVAGEKSGITDCRLHRMVIV